PPHCSQGCSTTRPVPPHCGHDDVRTNSPKMLRATCCSRPLPSQRGQVETCVPGCTPSPRHVAHCTATWIGTLAVVPRAASARAPRGPRPGAGRARAAARGAPARAPAEEIVAEERAEEVADVAEIEVARREPARAQSGVAVAVVELPGLGVREHLVGLGDL